MPFRGDGQTFENFDACLIHMKEKEGYTAEEAKKICGKMQAGAENSSVTEQDKEKSVEMLISQKDITFTEEPNGDIVFHDVTLMAEGTWTDSYSKKKNFYSAQEVAKMKFEKSVVKMNHDIFNQMPLTNEIGSVENERFFENPARWKGDVRIFPTQNGKDIALLLKRKQFRAISPEMFRTPIYDKENNRIIAKDLTFMGAATVREGACSLCTFNEGTEMAKEYSKDEMKDMLSYMKSHPEMMDDGMRGMMKSMMGEGSGKGQMMSATAGTQSQSSTNGDEITTNEGTPPTSGGTAGTGGAAVELDKDKQNLLSDMEKQLADAQKAKTENFITQHKALMKENADLKARVALLEKEKADADFSNRVKDLETQLKAVSMEPVIHTRIRAESSGQVVELSDPEFEDIPVTEFE